MPKKEPPSPKGDEFDEAQAHALDCAWSVFSPKLFEALVALIPEPPFDFQDAHRIERVIQQVDRGQGPSGLKRYIDEGAVLWELIVLAWSFHVVIQQVNEARLNARETPFGRYKDLLTKPDARTVCRFGLSYLKFVWRG
jgi:hypothetical protein